MQGGGRLELIEYLIAYTHFNPGQYLKIKQALSLVECTIRHKLTITALHSIMHELILEAKTITGGAMEKPSLNNSLIESFKYIYQEHTDTGILEFWFIDQNKLTKTIQKVLTGCIL